jgi:hypothetical protein
MQMIMLYMVIMISSVLPCGFEHISMSTTTVISRVTIVPCLLRDNRQVNIDVIYKRHTVRLLKVKEHDLRNIN